MTRTVNTKWFKFRQNNSGGHFDYDEASGIGVTVFIEAFDNDHANHRAERIGIYFDGAGYRDCECCGDRWYRVYEKGTEEPEFNPEYDFSYVADRGMNKIFLHDLDGKITALTKEECEEILSQREYAENMKNAD